MQISPKNSSRQRGFTLMELLIVMSIMIILMLIAIPNFISMKAQADETLSHSVSPRHLPGADPVPD